MQLSTTLKRFTPSSRASIFSSFERILQTNLQAGFKVLDLNLAHYTRWPSPVLDPTWQDFWKQLRDTAQKVGAKWYQGHAHFLDWEGTDPTEWAWHDELVRRTVVGAGIMGVKWLVVHPRTLPDAVWYGAEKSFQANVEMFKQYGEWAAEAGVNLAIENLIEKRQGRRFGASPEELLQLYSALDDPLFGICWDSGHAHLAGINQVEALRLIGNRLQALHICDNHGEQDEHLTPLSGTINWAPIMQALKEIGYTGTFSFEVVYRDQGQPDRLYQLFTETLFETGKYLLSLTR